MHQGSIRSAVLCDPNAGSLALMHPLLALLLVAPQILKFLESEEMHVTHYGLGLKGTAALIGALEVGHLRRTDPSEWCARSALHHCQQTLLQLPCWMAQQTRSRLLLHHVASLHPSAAARLPTAQQQHHHPAASAQQHPR